MSAAVEPVPQRTEEWLTTATANQITAAHAAGELAALLGGPVPLRVAEDRDVPVGAVDLVGLSPDAIAAAYHAGHLDEVLGRTGTGGAR